MYHFTICPTGEPEPAADLVADDSASVLNVMFRLGWREADILRDGAYMFTARLDANGVWSIFDRHGRARQQRAVNAMPMRAGDTDQFPIDSIGPGRPSGTT